MKVLILSVTAGNGHNACAKGMKEKLEANGVTVKVIDLLKEFSTPINVWTADKGYNLAVAKLLPLYNAFYNLYKQAKPENRYKCSAQGISVSTLRGLYKEINTFKPDVIYSTHFYGAVALTDLKLCYSIPCKTIVSNLDYVNSPFWEACIGVDYFAIPHEDFIDECIKEGFKKEQLIPTGIPVKGEFFNEIDKTYARKQLGLDEKTYTVMIMFGGGHWAGGVKAFEMIAKNFKKDIQIIMINGRDEAGFEKIEKMKKTLPKNVAVCNVGFTNQVDLYMSASDVIVDKLGGTSATEIINKKLPFVVTRELPAQEEYNLTYLEQKGFAKSFGDKKELISILEELMDEGKRKEISDKLALFRRNGMEELAKLILSQPKAEYNDEYISAVDYKKVELNVKKALGKAHRQVMKEHKEEREKFKEEIKKNKEMTKKTVKEPKVKEPKKKSEKISKLKKAKAQ